MSTTSEQTSSGPGSRRIRKGTHSCVECRRRKIRCIWPADAGRCNACAAKQMRCDVQTYSQSRAAGRKNKTLREKIRELEEIIDKVLAKAEGKGHTASSSQQGLRGEGDNELSVTETLQNLQLELQSITPSSSVLQSSAESEQGSLASLTSLSSSLKGLENAPVLSLFDNAILSREEENSLEDDEYPNASGLPQLRSLRGDHCPDERNERILRSLRALIPSQEALRLMLSETRLYVCQLQRNFPEMHGLSAYALDAAELETMVQDVINSLHSSNVAAITKTTISLATCIQQLPFGFSLGSAIVPAPLEVLQSSYIQSTETFLSMDDGIIGTIDGIECLLTLVRYYLNAGFPRKGWVIMRRAITFAYLLGGPLSLPASKSALRKRALWLQMWQLDRSLSLLLGLPYTMTQLPYPVDLDGPASATLPPPMRFSLKNASIATRIIDRNRNQENMSYDDTLHMEWEMQAHREIMPPAFWSTDWEAEPRLELIYDSLTLRFWFHNLRVLLHLPFALRALTDPATFGASVCAALESAREMMAVYFIFRDQRRPILRTCNIMDFQVFTAGMVVILCALADSNLPGHDQAARDADWDRVHHLVLVQSRVAQDIPDGVASQASQLLETLYELRAAQQHQNFSAGRQSFQAVIPYFGKLSINCLSVGRGVVKSSISGNDGGEQYPTVPIDGVYQNNQIHQLQQHEQSQAQAQAISFDNQGQFDNLQFWPAESSEWASLVDFSLQDEWTWDVSSSER